MSEIWLIRVARAPKHPHWKKGAWVAERRHPMDYSITFGQVPSLREASIYRTHAEALGAIERYGKVYAPLTFEPVRFREET